MVDLSKKEIRAIVQLLGITRPALKGEPTISSALAKLRGALHE